jgi:hypothetical protein
VLCFDTLEFDGDLFTRNDIGTQVDVTKTSTPNFSADAIFVADPKILFKDRLAGINEEAASSTQIADMGGGGKVGGFSSFFSNKTIAKRAQMPSQHCTMFKG